MRTERRDRILDMKGRKGSIGGNKEIEEKRRKGGGVGGRRHLPTVDHKGEQKERRRIVPILLQFEHLPCHKKGGNRMTKTRPTI